jgi:hypothetical protein
MKKAVAELAPTLPVKVISFSNKSAIYAAFSHDMYVSGNATQRPPTPGYQFRGNQRKRGRRSPVPLDLEIMTSPASPRISNDTSVFHPDCVSSCRGTSCRAPASSICPRRVSGLHGAERCDPQPLPEWQCRVACIPHTEGGALRTSCFLSSTCCCILLLQPTGPPPGASSCVSHSTAVPALPVPHSRGACMVLLVSLASDHPPPSPATVLPHFCHSANPETRINTHFFLLFYSWGKLWQEKT